MAGLHLFVVKAKGQDNVRKPSEEAVGLCTGESPPPPRPDPSPKGLQTGPKKGLFYPKCGKTSIYVSK